MGDREAEIKCLREQLTEANKAKEALQATQSNLSQSSQSDQATDIRATGDASQVLQEEVAKLRQEVFQTSFLKESYMIICIVSWLTCIVADCFIFSWLVAHINNFILSNIAMVFRMFV